MRTLADRQVLLPAEVLSVRTARHLVRDLLVETAHTDWSGAAELAVTELVTNSVLHGHTDVELHARVDVDGLRVEVRDRNPVLPALRHYDSEATTGRGMALVAAVTRSCGVTPLGPAGKIVWFVVGDDDDAAGDDLDALLNAWDDESPPEAGRTGLRVVLRNLPALLWSAAGEHEDALLREVALQRAAHAGPTGDLALADRARTALRDAVAAAIDQGAQGVPVRLPDGHPAQLPGVPDALDVTLIVDPVDRDAFGVLLAVLEQADLTASRERLLVRPSLPEVAAMRRWACSQVMAQLTGAQPTAWHTPEPADLEPVDSGGAGSDAVRVSTRGAVAADEDNRIVAVSRSLADALDYEVDELVGRRVVALVPPRYRQAHVAGFTRHLATGAASVLGVELELPVLRRDGSEVQCRFLIEALSSPTGGTTYVAWIEPLVP